nr:glycosyltransferase [uncultured Desulfobacter sp.]
MLICQVSPWLLYRKVLQVSAVHVYLTYPFVLSWSMLEAMACGCLVIGSATLPVEEVLQEGKNGLVVDFFDTQAIAEKVTAALVAPEQFSDIRMQASRDIRDRYSRQAGLELYRDLITPGICLPGEETEISRMGFYPKNMLPN